VIVHHTGSTNTRSALNTFLNEATSAHYVIDREGQIIKMVQDSRRAGHAGWAYWRGSTQVNSFSIGIELVHCAQDNHYSQAHYRALLGLLNALRTAHPTIETRNIIGHSDVATEGTGGRLGRKAGDPGEFFNWLELENQNIGLVPAAPAGAETPIYGGLFDQVPNGSFRRNDNDRRQWFGDAHRPDIEGTPVLDLQNDLNTIGYQVGTPDGVFGEMTHWAVKMFQEHFFAGGRGGNPDGRVDRATGGLIKRVLNGL
jgi:N-acetyl-anhydromuramyl-L-alanine amidase AmpD